MVCTWYDSFSPLCIDGVSWLFCCLFSLDSFGWHFKLYGLISSISVVSPLAYLQYQCCLSMGLIAVSVLSLHGLISSISVVNPWAY